MACRYGLHLPSGNAHYNWPPSGGARALWDWMSLKMDNRDVAGNSPRLPSGVRLNPPATRLSFALLSGLLNSLAFSLSM